MTSVCICTYNPKIEFLNRTVSSILNQDIKPEDLELIIIDNNSVTSVAEIPFLKDKRVQVVKEVKQGLTAARGRASEIAKGNIIVFVDDDIVLDSNYVKIANEVFEDKSIGIISGNIYPEYECSPEKWFIQFEEMLAIRRYQGTEFISNHSAFYNNLFPVGAGMCIRRELIQSYYCSHLTAENYIEGRKGTDLSSAEDIDLCFYAIHMNFKIGISPLLNSVHIIPKERTTFSYVSKLAQSSLKSTHLVDLKWSGIFKHTVFEHFSIGFPNLIARTTFHKLFSFHKAQAIKYIYFSNLLKYRWNRR